MSIIPYVNVLVLVAASWMLWRKAGSEIKTFFIPALLFRIGCGIGLGLIYLYVYTVGDTFQYFEQGSRIAKMAGGGVANYLVFLWSGEDLYGDGSVLPPRALFLSKIASVVILISGFNYWITTVYFSFIAFLSSWILVKEIGVCRDRYMRAAVFAFLFFPSAVFWSSGLIKESLAMACLFFLVFVSIRLWRRAPVSPWHWTLLVPAVWILWGLKYYYLAVLLPVIFTELVMQLLIRPRLRFGPGVGAVIWLAVFMIPIFSASLVHPNFYPERFLDVVVSNYEIFEQISDPGDLIHYPGLSPDVASILMHAPKAMLSGLYRPFIWEADGFLQLVSALENALLVVLTAGFVIRSFQTRKIEPLFIPCVVYCLLLITFLALSTPNFGTLSRYRVGLLPFFVFLITTDNYFVNFLRGLVQRR